MKRAVQIAAALVSPLFAWGDANPTVYKWPGSFALDTRPVKAIDTQADLDAIQPIVLKTRDAVVTQTAPYTGLKTELAWKPGADGTGELAWTPSDGGTWKLAKSGSDGSGSATFEVARALFHGSEDGKTAATAYAIPSTSLLTEMLEAEDSPIAVGTFIKIDTAWVKLSDLYAAASSIGEKAVKYVLQDGTTDTYQIVALGENEAAPYTGIWDAAQSIGTTTVNGSITTTEVTGIMIDNRPRTSAEPLAFASNEITAHSGATTNANGETTVLWPLTFEKGEQNSLRYLDPNSGNWVALTGGKIDPSRPDKSGTLTWNGPTDGGIYQVNNQAQGRTAYFSFPYSSVEGDGTADNPYQIATTNAFGRLVADGTLTTGKYIKFVGALASSGSKYTQMVAAVGEQKGIKTIDSEAQVFQFVDSDGTEAGNPSYDIVSKFALSTTARSNEANLRTVTSLADILPIRYSGGNVWAFDNKIEAKVAVRYAPDFNEENLTEKDEQTFTGMGETTFAPDANGLYKLTHTSRGESQTARFQIGDAGSAALATSWAGELGGDSEAAANEAGDALKNVLATLGLKTISLSLNGNIVNTNFVAGALQVPASVESITIDLKGRTLSGIAAVADVTQAGAGLKLLGTKTALTVIDTVGGGMLTGGLGYDADSLHAAVHGGNGIEFPIGYVGTVVIGDGVKEVTVAGGKGGDGRSYGAGAGGYSALSFAKEPTAAVTVKNRALVEGGAGGSSTVGNGGSGAAAIYVAFVDNSTPETETGSLALTVEAGGEVRGGAGGSSTVSSSGAGGAAARLPTSEIVSNTVTVASGAVVAGGDAGDAGVAGTTAKGGAAITGAVTIESSDDSDPDEALAGGATGSYVITSQEDLDILADNYASNSGNTAGILNVKVSENAEEGLALSVDEKVQGLNLDLNGQSVASVEVKGATGTTITDTAENGNGSVGTVTTGSGSSVDIAGGNVTNVNAGDDANVSVSGGNVDNVSAGAGTKVEVKGNSTVNNVTSTDATNPAVVVVEEGVSTPQTDSNTVTATYLTNANKEIAAAGTYILAEDITGGLEVAYAATIDLNGHIVTGVSGAAEGEDGEPALSVTAAVAVTVTGEGTLAGGNGADGTATFGKGAAAVAAVEGATVTVGDGVAQVAGADGFGTDNLPTVKIVKMLQRYPWNGYVDIDYTLTGNLSNVELQLAFTVSGGEPQTATKFLVKPTVEAGTHRMTWNAAAEIVDGYVDKASVTLKLVRKVAVTE